MKSLWYRYHYGFELTQAYLAGMMGDTMSMNNHLSMADRVWIKWWKESL